MFSFKKAFTVFKESIEQFVPMVKQAVEKVALRKVWKKFFKNFYFWAFTCFGPEDNFTEIKADLYGLIPWSFSALFEYVNRDSDVQSVKVIVEVNFNIYN